MNRRCSSKFIRIARLALFAPSMRNSKRRLSTEHFVNRTTDYGLDNELRLEGDERSATANVTVNLTRILSLVICGFLTTSLN
jgi:hypothetical protein